MYDTNLHYYDTKYLDHSPRATTTRRRRRGRERRQLLAHPSSDIAEEPVFISSHLLVDASPLHNSWTNLEGKVVDRPFFTEELLGRCS